MRLRFLLLAAALFAATIPALATPQLRDGTDIWIDPAEPGWGLNIIHQGDTLFAALFVYGADGQPRWYVASSLAGADDGPLHDRAAIYSGALYEATGPWFGAQFDPNAVTRRQVGTMTIELGYTISVVDYTVDGVRVYKQVRPFTFRATNLTGNYYGYQYQPQGANGTLEIRRPLSMFITDNGSSITMSSMSNSQSACDYAGTRGQNGQIETVNGTFNCGSRSGFWSMAVDPTPNGFTGTFTGNGITSFWGRIAASTRRLAPQYENNGWRTDLWFPPDESGWGLNVVEQGDTIFATLFVYDAQRRPRWYVASQLTQSGAGLTASYSGPLYETTGPYFASPFNPAAVTRRQVGTMVFQARDRGTGYLSYTVDGVTVTKSVQRYAFRKNDLSGTYVGHTVATNADAPAGLTYTEITISIDDSESGFTMTTKPEPVAAPPDGACSYRGPPAAQIGGLRFAGGTYSCQGSSGTFTMENIFVTFDGFTATFKGRGIDGYIEGARLGMN